MRGDWGGWTRDLPLGAPIPGVAGCTSHVGVNPPPGRALWRGRRSARGEDSSAGAPSTRSPPPGVPVPPSAASQPAESPSRHVRAAATGAQSLGHAQPCASPRSNYIMVPPARGAWQRRGRLCSCDPPWQRPASVNKPIPQHARLGCIYVNLGWGTSERIINTARPLPWKGRQLAPPSHPQSLALSPSASSPRSAVYTQERGGAGNKTPQQDHRRLWVPGPSLPLLWWVIIWQRGTHYSYL